MKKVRVLMILGLVVVLALALGTGSAATQKTIGFSVYDMQYSFFQQMEKGTKAQIEKLGYKYILQDEKVMKL